MQYCSIKFVSDLEFSPGTQVSSINKTDHHDITEILLKVALDTITLTMFLLVFLFVYILLFTAYDISFFNLAIIKIHEDVFVSFRRLFYWLICVLSIKNPVTEYEKQTPNRRTQKIIFKLA